MLPPGYVIRPAAGGDLEDVASVVIAADIEQLGEPDWSVEDQAEEWADSRLDLSTDTRVVLDPDGAVVAYACVLRRDEGTEFDSETYVLPAHDGRGIEEHLLEFVEQRARQLLAPGASHARVAGFCLETDSVRAARLRDAGFSVIRHFFRMTIRPSSADPPDTPAGVEVRRASREEDLRSVHHVLTESFRGHFRSVAVPFDEWRQRHSARADDGAPMLLAELDGTVVGALVSSRTTPGVGWVRSLGVLREARGRGVGSALLARAFDEFSRLGAERVSLGVDAENATGAIALYERAGMGVERRIDVYAKELTG